MRGIQVMLLGSALACGAASADRVDLFVFENADNADVSGLDVWVDVVQTTSGVEMVFHNDSTIDSFVSAVYVESTPFSDGALSSGAIAAENGADFEPRATPTNPPGSISAFGGAWGGVLFSADKEPAKGTGIDPSESLTLEFELEGTATFDDVLTALAGPEFRFAAHVQGIGPSSVWVTSEPLVAVPLPAGLGLGLAGLGVLGVGGVIRRR